VVYPADAAGGENRDARGARQGRRTCHCRRTTTPQTGGDGHVPEPELGEIRIGTDSLQVLPGQPDVGYSVEDRNGGRRRAVAAYGVLEFAAGLDVAGAG